MQSRRMGDNSDTHQRTTNACDRCRKRKSKCSGTEPCDYCLNHNVSCSYTYVKKKRSCFRKNPSDIPIPPVRQSNEYYRPYSVSSAETEDPGPKGFSRAFESLVKEKLGQILEVNEKLLHKVATMSSTLDGLTARIAALESIRTDMPTRTYHEITHGKRQRKDSLDDVAKLPAGGDASDASDTKQEDQLNFPSQRFTELVSSINSSSIFSTEVLQWIKQKTGPNFEIFRPVIDTHLSFLEEMGRTIKYEFNDLKTYDDYLFFRPQLVRYFVRMFLKLHSKSFLVSDEEAFDLYYRFYEAHPLKHQQHQQDFAKEATKKEIASHGKPSSPKSPYKKNTQLTDSELLMFSAMICSGCFYVSSKLHQLSQDNKPKTPTQLELENEVMMNAPRLLLEELEWNSMKNCFYYFLKVQKKNEGRATVVGMLVLYLYLNSTIYSKFNYFILSCACKHAKMLGYHSLSSDNPNADQDYWEKKLIWANVYLFNQDMASALEKDAFVKDEHALHEIGFVNVTKFYIRFFLKELSADNLESSTSLPDIIVNDSTVRLRFEEIARNNLLSLDTDLVFDSKRELSNPAKLYAILHSAAQYSYQAFTILTYYYGFSIAKLISSFSKQNFLDNILKTIPGIKGRSNPEAKRTFLDKMYSALDHINYMSQQFQEWSSTVPENIRPGRPLDVTMYQYVDPANKVDPEVKYWNNPRFTKTESTKGRQVAANRMRLSFSGYDVEDLPDSLELSAALLIICQFKYHYHLMKTHRFAFQACSKLANDQELLQSISRATLADPLELETELRARIELYQGTSLNGALEILRLSITVFKNHYHAVYWCINYINGAYFALFMNNIRRYPLKTAEQELEDKLQCTYLMIDCYAQCLSRSYFPAQRGKVGVKDVFNRRLLMLSVAHFHDKYQYNVKQDSKLQEFLMSLEGDDKETVKRFMADTMADTTQKRPFEHQQEDLVRKIPKKENNYNFTACQNFNSNNMNNRNAFEWLKNGPVQQYVSELRTTAPANNTRIANEVVVEPYNNDTRTEGNVNLNPSNVEHEMTSTTIPSFKLTFFTLLNVDSAPEIPQGLSSLGDYESREFDIYNKSGPANTNLPGPTSDINQTNKANNMFSLPELNGQQILTKTIETKENNNTHSAYGNYALNNPIQLLFSTNLARIDSEIFGESVDTNGGPYSAISENGLANGVTNSSDTSSQALAKSTSADELMLNLLELDPLSMSGYVWYE